MIRKAVLLGACFALVGCKTINPLVAGRNLAAAEHLSIVEDKCMATSGDMLAVVLDVNVAGNAGGSDNNNKKVSPECFNQISNFQKVYSSGTNKKSSRNEIMDSIIAESNAKCATYARLLKNSDAVMNGSLGVLAIITGGLGAFVGGAGAAKALSGSSAIITGTRAELNETVLNNQTIQLLAASFEVARARKLQEITNLQACSMEQYSVMRGIADAIDYHRECSLLVGLAEATRSVERSNNPGVDALRQQLQGISALRVQAQQFGMENVPEVAKLAASGNLSALQQQDSILTAARKELEDAAQKSETESKKLTEKMALKVDDSDPTLTQQAIDTAVASQKRVFEAAKLLEDEKKVKFDQARSTYSGMIALTGGNQAVVESGALKNRQCPFQANSTGRE